MQQYNFQYCPKIIVLSKDRTTVLLCKRKGEADYDGVFSFPGGKMETTDQSIVEGIQREKNEELGEQFKISLLQIFSLNILFRKKDGNAMIVPHYIAFHQGGEISLSQEEYSEYKWVTITELDAFGPKIENIPEMVRQVLRLAEISSEKDFGVI